MRIFALIVVMCAVYCPAVLAEPAPHNTPVFISNSFGEQSYHLEFCTSVNRGFGKKEITLQRAIEQHRKPCTKCQPPEKYVIAADKTVKKSEQITLIAHSISMNDALTRISTAVGVRIDFHSYRHLRNRKVHYKNRYWLDVAKELLATENLDLVYFNQTYHVVARGTSVDRLKTIIATESDQKKRDDAEKLRAFNQAKQSLHAKNEQQRKTPKAGRRSKAESDGGTTELPPAMSTGTGFSVSTDGYIVTAYHVVQDGTGIKVKFEESDEWLNAELIASSKANDIAILKVEHPLENYLPIADTFDLKQADRVFTIGYPVTDILGEESKYTEGYISSMSGIFDIDTLMQISVPIQPGNSGGPLVTVDGSVVGVIISTASAAAFYEFTGSMPQNINFAIKSDYIKLLIQSNNLQLSKLSRTVRDDPIENTSKSICFINVSI